MKRRCRSVKDSCGCFGGGAVEMVPLGAVVGEVGELPLALVVELSREAKRVQLATRAQWSWSTVAPTRARTRLRRESKGSSDLTVATGTF